MGDGRVPHQKWTRMDTDKALPARRLEIAHYFNDFWSVQICTVLVKSSHKRRDGLPLWITRSVPSKSRRGWKFRRPRPATTVTLMIKWHLFEDYLASNALRALIDILEGEWLYWWKAIFNKDPPARGYAEKQTFPRKAFFGKALEAIRQNFHNLWTITAFPGDTFSGKLPTLPFT